MKNQIYSALRRRIRAIILCGIICIYSLFSSAYGPVNTDEPSSRGVMNAYVTVISH